MTVYQTENNDHEGVRLPTWSLFYAGWGEGSKMVVIRWQRSIKMNVIKGFVYEKG